MVHGVNILGPVDLPSQSAYHASQMYARNITTFLLSMVVEGELAPDPADEIVAETLLTNDGEVVHPRLRELLGLEPLAGVETKGGE